MIHFSQFSEEKNWEEKQLFNNQPSIYFSSLLNTKLYFKYTLYKSKKNKNVLQNLVLIG
jgi:hypothetical protein